MGETKYIKTFILNILFVIYNNNLDNLTAISTII